MIKLFDVSKKYVINKTEQIHALNNVTLEFADTGLVFVLGKSGSGKTTLLNVLGGLDSATSGQIEIDGVLLDEFGGKDYDNYRNFKVGFVFQDYNLIEDYNVGENIALALELQKVAGKEEKVKQVLEQVGLGGYEKRKIKQLSGGQKQRIAIARALVKSPCLILADEPTGNLDSSTSREIYDILKELSKKCLIIVVSHDVDSAEIYGDRIIKMRDGFVSEDIERTQASAIDNSREKNTEIVKERKVSGNISFLSTLKMSLKNLWKRKFRMLVTAILFFVTLSMFGAGVSILTKNQNERYREAYLQEGLNFFTLLRWDNGNFSSEEADELITENPENSIIKNYKVRLDPLELESTDSYDYYPKSLGYASVININQLNYYGFEIDGALPIEGEREILITKYIAEWILYRQDAYCLKYGLRSMNDLIGHEFHFRNMDSIRISGIIDTRIPDKYEKLKNDDTSVWKPNILTGTDNPHKRFQNYMENSIHLNVWMNQDFYNSFLGDEYYGSFQYYDDFNSLNESSVALSDTKNITLDLSKVDFFAERRMPRKGEIIIDSRTGKDYVRSEQFIGSAPTHYIEMTVKPRLVSGVSPIKMKFEIIGMVKDEFANDIKTSILSEEDMSLINKKDIVQTFTIALSDKKSDAELFQFINSKGYYNYYINDYVYEQVFDVNNSLTYALDVAKWIFLGVAIFTILMMLNFIISTINDTKKQIGILRAIGVKQINVYAVFLYEMLILCLIVALISVLGVFGISQIMGNFISRSSPIVNATSIMPLSAASVFSMLGFGIIVALLGSAIPILTKTRKKPIDLLR